MAFDLAALLADHQGESFDLHSQFMNPQLVKVLATLGFDRHYIGGEGSYLIDDRGERYLDFLSGFGVFALGRGHPVIKDALHQALDADLPNLIQLDCALLPGLLAQRAGPAVSGGDQPSLLHQLGCRFDRDGHQVRPLLDRSQPDPLLRPRVSRTDQWGPVTQRGQGVPRRLRPAATPLRPGPFRGHRRTRATAPSAGRGRLRGRAHPG